MAEEIQIEFQNAVLDILEPHREKGLRADEILVQLRRREPAPNLSSSERVLDALQQLFKRGRVRLGHGRWTFQGR